MASINRTGSTYRLTLLLLIFVIVFLALELAHVYLGDNPTGWTRGIADVLGFVIVSVLSFICSNILWEMYNKRASEEQIEKAILLTISQNNTDVIKYLARLDENEVVDFLKESVTTLGGKRIGADEARVLWSEQLGPYLARRSSFRRDFSYNINMRECRATHGLATALAGVVPAAVLAAFCADYLVCEQAIRYSKKAGVALKDGTIEAVFTLDANALQKYMKDGDVYFRELLTLGAPLAEAIRRLSPADLDSWVRRGWGFEAVSAESGDKLEYSVNWVARSGQPNSVIRIVIQPGEERGPDQLVTLSFAIPHLKSENHYMVKLPEPTEKPEIDMQVHMDGVTVQDFVFLGTASVPLVERVPPSAPTQVKIRGNGWAFPTSGALFVWRGP